MPEFDNDRFQEWKQFVGTNIELLKKELEHYSSDYTNQFTSWRRDCKELVDAARAELREISGKLNNGLSRRVDQAEYKINDLERFIVGLKGFMTKLALGLLTALIIAVAGGYIAISNRDNFRERELTMLREQVKQVQDQAERLRK
jgi:exonuclease VII large subunit